MIMKTKFYYVLTLGVILTVSYALSNAFVGVETAYAQLQPNTEEISDNDGGNGNGDCIGGLCESSNGNHYSTLFVGATKVCCGATSSSPGCKDG
jgi:hypothetical protein